MAERADAARWMRAAIALARRCAPSPTAFSVGALVVAPGGRVLGRGFSRQTGPRVHAEEVALSRAAARGPVPAGSTLVSSMEPCGRRLSRRRSCADRIVAAGVARVVFAAAEPPVFVARPTGTARLRRAGVVVVRLPLLAPGALAANAHLLARGSRAN